MAGTRRITYAAIAEANKSCSPSTPKNRQKILPIMVEYIPFGESCKNGNHVTANTFSKKIAESLVKVFLVDCRASGIDTNCRAVKEFIVNIKKGRKIGSRHEHRLCNDDREARGMADCNHVPKVSTNSNKTKKSDCIVAKTEVMMDDEKSVLETECFTDESRVELIRLGPAGFVCHWYKPHTLCAEASARQIPS